MLLMRLGRAATAQEVVRHNREARSLEVLDLRPPVHQRCAGAVHEDHDVARPAVDDSAGTMVDSKDPPRPHDGGQIADKVLQCPATFDRAVVQQHVLQHISIELRGWAR